MIIYFISETRSPRVVYNIEYIYFFNFDLAIVSAINPCGSRREYGVYNVYVGHIRTNRAIACKDLDLRYSYFSHIKDSLY